MNRGTGSDELRERVLADPTVPEPVRAALERGFALDEIRLDRHGQWWHQGERIQHPRIAELFSKSVQRTEGGTWVLGVGRFTYPIVVEDTPFFITGVRIDGRADRVDVELNDGSTERLDLSTLEYERPGQLTAGVKSGGLRARFLRRAYHALLEHVEMGEAGPVLRIGHRSVALTTGSDSIE